MNTRYVYLKPLKYRPSGRYELTEEGRRFMIECYPHMNNRDVMAELGVGCNVLFRFARQLALVKSPEHLAEIRKRSELKPKPKPTAKTNPAEPKTEEELKAQLRRWESDKRVKHTYVLPEFFQKKVQLIMAAKAKKTNSVLS